MNKRNVPMAVQHRNIAEAIVATIKVRHKGALACGISEVEVERNCNASSRVRKVTNGDLSAALHLDGRSGIRKRITSRRNAAGITAE